MKNQYNYLFVMPTDRIGGAERVAMNLVLHLAENKSIKVQICFLNGTNTGGWRVFESYSNVELLFLDARREIAGVYQAILYFMRNPNEYSMVYTTHIHVNSFVALLRKLFIIKANKHVARESTVIFDRFFGVKRLLAKLLYHTYSNVDLVICQTNYMRERFLSEVSSVSEQKVLFLSNPLNLKDINNATSDVYLGSISNLNKFIIVQVGRLVDIKNHILSFQALALLGSHLSYEYWIIGDGPKINSLKQLAKDLGIYKKLKFVGNVGNPYLYMSLADLGILSSIKEGFPNVLIEMMASGTKNIITTNCAGGLEELPKVTVVHDFTPSSLSSAIEKSISERLDNTVVYKNYVGSRDVSNYWLSIVNFLGCFE